MHQALYRKYRPAVFEDVYGQNHITSVLKYEVANNKASHAYLFCGSRGTGKTTCAKILAKAVNCLNPHNGDPCGKCEACIAISENTTVDILEMDAASNTGVDYIREIKDAVVYSPAMLKTRVYIIDEVHMLSVSAFNALLKTLEEPPKQVIFILCTTEIQKIPVTVLSRCQRFDFHRIASDIIAQRLEYIANKENITLNHDAAMLIARLSNGGMRDAISLLEVSSGQDHDVTIERVRECAGVSDRENLIKTVNAIAEKNWDNIFSVIAEIVSSSMDIAVFWQELIGFYRDMMLVKATKNAINNYELTDEEIEQTKECASNFTLERIIYHTKLLDNAFYQMQQKSTDRRICAEMALVSMTETNLDSSTDALLARISELENKINQLSIGIDLSNTASQSEPKISIEPKKPKETECESVSDSKPVSDWPEILKIFEKQDPAAAAFLANAETEINGNEFIIKVSDALSKMMIESGDNMNSLKQTIFNVNAEYAPLKITIKQNSNGASKKRSPMDDINF